MKAEGISPGGRVPYVNRLTLAEMKGLKSALTRTFVDRTEMARLAEEYGFKSVSLLRQWAKRNVTLKPPRHGEFPLAHKCRCKKCSPVRNLRWKAYREARKEAGFCPRCRLKALPGKVLCGPCDERNREQAKEYYEKRRFLNG